MEQHVLVAEDDEEPRIMLCEFLVEQGWRVTEASTGSEVLRIMSTDDEHRPQLAIIELKMPELSGFDVLRALKKKMSLPLPVIVITGNGSSSAAIEAIQLGAFDYFSKPFDLNEILVTVQRFFDWVRLNDQLVAFSSQFGVADPNELIVGNSLAMQEVYKTIGRVARTDATVLIQGETGTGKELVATVLHRNSGYSAGPLVKVNCAALPETLLESELFGHEKGAFTGAIAQRKGRFELANKGTIFLDEIGEMSLSTQQKFLRVLQEREFERVGGSHTVKIDTRVIAATNRNLQQDVIDGRFREDLYYRLNVITIALPPLRERKDDIPPLVERFLHKYRSAPKAGPARISESALEMITEYEWPGNVRELENVIERGVILSLNGTITDAEIDFTHGAPVNSIDVRSQLRNGASLAELTNQVEELAIEMALAMAHDGVEAAAEMLGLEPEDLERRLKAMEPAATLV